MPYDSDIIVVGCGNILFKDDGFGPILINLLQKYSNDTNDYYDPVVTSYVEEDFNKNILNQIQEKFEGITLPDSIHDPNVMQIGKYDNPHGMTVEEPLQKISEKCEVVVVGCKPAEIPTPDVDMGLTEPVEKAVPEAIDIILNEIGVK